MPTIKKTGIGSELRIITKVVNAERRVSCSCCEVVECCMYPADELGGGYLEADLPDALQVNWAGQSTGEVGKSGSEYISGNVTLKRNEAGTLWILEDSSTDPKTTRFVGRCLIRGDGNLTQGNDLVEDNFADIYNVYIPYDGGVDIEVTRTSLCQWYGTAVIGGLTYGATLYYNDGAGDQAEATPAHTWNILPFVTGGGIEIYGTKPSGQGTPLGNYTAEISPYIYVVS